MSRAIRIDGDELAERVDELVNPSRARRRRTKRLVNPGDQGCCCDGEEDLSLDPLDPAKLHRWMQSQSFPEELASAHPIAVARWLEPEVTRWFDDHPPPPHGPVAGLIENRGETPQSQAREGTEHATSGASAEALVVFHPLTGRQVPIGASPGGVRSPRGYEKPVDPERARRRG